MANQIKKGLILDPIHPSDFNHFDIIFTCEQCSHFQHSRQECTIGYAAKEHIRDVQLDRYQRLGRVAFCRFTEID